MLYYIAKFEFIRRLKRLETYLFFGVIVFFAMIAFNFIFEGQDLGLIKENAPYIVAKVMTITTGFFLFIVSMIMGVPVLRDFEHHMEAFIFINPIEKMDYLLGRFIGSFLILILIFSALPIGMLLGEFLPWRTSEQLLSFNLFIYLKPFLILILPTLFVSGSIFFITGTLSRKLLVVYTQGLLFLMLTLISLSLKNPILSSILEPLSYGALDEITGDWLPAVINQKQIPFTGVLLLNRVLWILIGTFVLWIGCRVFKFSVIKEGRKSVPVFVQNEQLLVGAIPKYTRVSEYKVHWRQLWQQTTFQLKLLLREPSFWAIVGCGAIIILINSINLGTTYGVDSLPTTYLILEELTEMALYFFLIILVFYPGELIWKERGSDFDEIVDSTSVSDFALLGGKFLALIASYALLLFILILAGIVFQITCGHYEFDLRVYFVGFYLEFFPFLILFTIPAFFIHVLVNSKYIGHLVFIVFFIGLMAINIFGVAHPLYSYGGIGLKEYSEMNGYGHFIYPFVLFKIYWFAFAWVLFIIAVALSVRGKTERLRERITSFKYRLSPNLRKSAFLAFLVFLFMGVYLAYNAFYINTYYSQSDKNAFRAEYENKLKSFEYKAQPKITDVNLSVDLFPSKRTYLVEGFYILQNQSNQPINAVQVQRVLSGDDEVRDMFFSKAGKLDSQFVEYGFFIFHLEESLLPGDTMKFNFKQELVNAGIKENESGDFMVGNGTFFDNDRFPTIGYNTRYELRDDQVRAEYNLAPFGGMSEQPDMRELVNGRSGDDGSKINFEMRLSTTEDQIAIAPGELIGDSISNGRRYFDYKLNGSMINFYSMVSARYEVLKESWISKDDQLDHCVDLEIYYHKGHEHNIDRMMRSMKQSLRYFSQELSPYKYGVLRIMEYPRYRSFAQSFPTVIPFSEGLGFILDVDDSKDVDMPFFITSHEVAHQWWGLHLVAANVKGKNLIVETLAQFTALMVLEEAYGEIKVRQLLSYFEKRYNEGKRADQNEEKPLILVEKEDYLYYFKGALAMYELKENIGEKAVNSALKAFVKDWNVEDGSLSKDRFPTTLDLINYFKAELADSEKAIVSELFEEVWSPDSACYEADVDLMTEAQR